MYPPGHVGITLLLFAPLAYALIVAGNERAAIGWLGVAIVFTLAPDVDALLPGIVHRGVTHTLLAAVVLGLVVAVVGWSSSRSSRRVRAERGRLGFLVGTGSVLSHLLGDVITPMGVRPFLPIQGAVYTFDVVRASNLQANASLLVVGVTLSVIVSQRARARTVTNSTDTPDVEAEESIGTTN